MRACNLHFPSNAFSDCTVTITCAGQTRWNKLPGQTLGKEFAGWVLVAVPSPAGLLQSP